MKVLLYEDPTAYRNKVDDATREKKHLQAALDAYAALSLPAAITSDDLTDLYYNPKLLLEHKLTGGGSVPIGGGLAIEQGKVYDLIQKPAGTAAFLAQIAAIREPKNQPLANYVDTKCYELVDGELRLTEATLAKFQEYGRVYATNQKQLDEWEQLQIIAQALNTIRQNGGFGENFNGYQYLRTALVGGGNTQFSGGTVRPDALHLVADQRLK